MIAIGRQRQTPSNDLPLPKISDLVGDETQLAQYRGLAPTSYITIKDTTAFAVRRLGTEPMSKVAESPLLFAFRCFPGFCAERGEAKNGPEGPF